MRAWLLTSLLIAAPALAQTPNSAAGPERAGRGRRHHLQQQSRPRAGYPADRHAGRPLAPGIPRRLGPDPPRDGDARRRGHRHRRAEFRFRPALARRADAESGRRDDHAGAHQPGDRRRNPRARPRARRQWRRRPPDRRADRGAARRRPAGPGDLRSCARRTCAPGRPCRSPSRASAPDAGRSRSPI